MMKTTAIGIYNAWQQDITFTSHLSTGIQAELP
jgi:hypothetical protein